MNTADRKKIAVIQKYIVENFSDGDWVNLGQVTNSTEEIVNHPRLMRSKNNGDDDYEFCVAEVMNTICVKNESNIESIIDFYDIDLWYKQKDRAKYERVFQETSKGTAQFWRPGFLKVFLSHLSSSKGKATALKDSLGEWGMSSFVAHEDIEPTKEWMTEIELGLNTMDVLIAMVEPGFKESNWTDQEVGYALGRQIEVISIRVGADPHGFLGKYQGIQAKGKVASIIAKEILSVLLKKPKTRIKLISALNLCLSTVTSTVKISRIREIETLNLLNQGEMKEILEGTNLVQFERASLRDLVSKYKAFASEVPGTSAVSSDDLPF